MTIKKTGVILAVCAVLLSGCSTADTAGTKEAVTSKEGQNGGSLEAKKGDQNEEKAQAEMQARTAMETQTEKETQAEMETRTDQETQAGGDNQADQETSEEAYHKIDAEEAKRMMDEEEVVIVDVRRIDEYETSHIPGAVLIPNEDIGEAEPEKLPDKDAVLVVYCRTGVRSKEASEKLVKLGYKNVYDMGGIMSWPYETITERTGFG